MPFKSPKFDKNDVEIITKAPLFKGFFTLLGYKVRHRLFAGGWSEPISRELLARGEAAAAIVYDPVHKLIGLVEQFRVGAIDAESSPWCLEVVAGIVENNESPEALMRRELEEEAGIDTAELIPISSYYSTPGGCSEKIHLFCAVCDLQGKEGIFGLPEEGEDIRFHVLPAAEVFEHMYTSRTNNAATLIGLQWLQANQESLHRG